MTDGKQQLIEFVSRIHPNEEISIDDLAPGRNRALPSGLSLTDNPMSFSIVNPDPTRTTLFGPLSNIGVTVRVKERAGEVLVTGLDLLVAIARVVETGPPTHQKSAQVLANWWRAQIATCAPFDVPEPAPRDRAENEMHIEACTICQPVSMAMAASISAGSSAYKDTDVATMIEMAHADQAGAIRHYDAKRAALMATPTVSAKPSRRKTAVEQVPA